MTKLGEKLREAFNRDELPTGYVSEHFRATEFACNHCHEIHPDGVNVELVAMLEKLRAHFDAPVAINSGYRCPTHNKNVGGATQSQHLLGKAADVVVTGVSPAEVYAWGHTNNPNGGVGKYNSFTHLDVRSGKARW